MLLSIGGPCTAQAVGGKDSVAADQADQRPRSYISVIADKDLTMAVGARNIIAAENLISYSEDHFIGTKWFPEENLAYKFAGSGLRAGKYLLLDLPIDYFAVVLNHEYFGHGYRYRELNIDQVDYGFDAPPPYGKGGGQASVNLGPGVVNEHELISIWESGINSHYALNRELGLRWIASGNVNYREASLYFWSFQIMYTYVQDAGEDLSTGAHDSDPQAYVRHLNLHAGSQAIDDFKFTVRDLKSKFNLDIANPLIYQSIFTILKTGLWDGDTEFKLRMIPVGELEFLPVMRTGLTPFGCQYHMENYFRYGDKTGMLDLRLGDGTFYKSWGGAGLIIRNIYTIRRFSFDTQLEFWKQPKMEIGVNPVSAKGGTGGAAAIRTYYDLKSEDLPLYLSFEVGYKSAGFLEGYLSDSAPILSAGLSLRY